MEATLEIGNVRMWKKYTKNHSTEHPAITAIPDNWTAIRLKWVLSKVGSGKTPRGGGDAYVSDGVMFLRSQNVHFRGLALDDTVYINEETDVEMSISRVQPNDVLLNITGASLGRCSLVPSQFGRANVNQHVCILRARKVIVEPSFLCAAISSSSVQSQIFSTENGISREGLNFAQIANLVVALPKCIKEQRAIAAFLDRETARIDAMIGHKQRLIALLEEKRQAVISHAVTKGLDPDVKMKDSGVEWIGQIPDHWTVPPVAAFCNIVRGGSPRPAGDPEFFNGTDTPWITVAETTKDKEKYLTETAEYLTAEGRKRSRFLEGDTFILTNSGATLGVPKILRIAGCINDGSVAFLNTDQRMSKDFLYYYFTSQTDDIRIRMNQGMGQPNLNTNIVSRMPVPCPPIDEQLEIATYLDDAYKKSKEQLNAIRDSIELMNEYRTALISAAVTGQIDVRDEVQLDG